MANRRVPLNPKASAYYGSPRPVHYAEQRYQDLRQGPIHPSQITKNGTALFNFVNGLAQMVSQTESNELAARYLTSGKQRDSFYHSKLPDLQRVGQDMANMMNQGDRMRSQMGRTNVIEVPLENLLNADKAFANLTQGSKRPVIQNNYKEESKTMSDIDISEYLGGTPQRSAVQQNNTFYVNMDKTTKALLAEQVKTNKLLGVLVQSVRENGLKIDELPQHIAELVAANNLPDSDLGIESLEGDSDTIDDDLLP